MVVIQTHNGKIHADETIAIALLSNYFFKRGASVSILRSRDVRDFPNSDILVDVGNQYNHEETKYDHHQEGFNEKWSEDSPTLLSAAGLIWRHYGKDIVEMYLSANWDEFDFSENYTEETITEIVDIVYRQLFLEIDANDNGVILDEKEGINIPSIINSLNHFDTSDDESQNDNFYKAIELVSTILDIEFKEIIRKYFNYNQDIQKVKKYNLSKSYIVVDEKIPTIAKCLDQLDPNKVVKFLIFSGEKWTVKTRNWSKFSPVCSLPNPEQISALSHPEEVLFIHKSGFLAKTKTLATAEELVHLALYPPQPVPVKTKPRWSNLPWKSIVKITGASIAISLIGWWYLKE